jgi:hypothetical protein
MFFWFRRSVAKDIEYATKEINNVAGEISVRVSSPFPHLLRSKAESLVRHSYSNKSTATRRKAPSEPPLKIPLLPQIVLPT